MLIQNVQNRSTAILTISHPLIFKFQEPKTMCKHTLLRLSTTLIHNFYHNLHSQHVTRTIEFSTSFSNENLATCIHTTQKNLYSQFNNGKQNTKN